MTEGFEGLPDRTRDKCADAQERSPIALGVTRFVPRRDWRELTQPPVALHEGRTYEAWHPFVREEYQPPPMEPTHEDGPWIESRPVASWRPGWTYEPCGQYGEDSEEHWDGEGEQLRTIVSIHKPGRYPTRIFYVRQWRDPDGKVFGKGALRSVVAGTFRAWMRGERWPTYAPARKAHCLWALMPVSVAREHSSPRQVVPPIREDSK